MMRRAAIVMPGYAGHGPETSALAAFGLTTTCLDCGGDRKVLADRLATAELVFVRAAPLDAGVIGALTFCRGIVRYGVGVDTADLAAATAKGIPVTRVPHCGAEIEVADHSLALFLAARRRIVSCDVQVRGGVWTAGQAEPVARIAGQTADLVGFGRIGQAVAHRLRAF